jgi:hypothetical protein
MERAAGVTVIQPNEDGSYWRKIVRNKIARMVGEETREGEDLHNGTAWTRGGGCQRNNCLFLGSPTFQRTAMLCEHLHGYIVIGYTHIAKTFFPGLPIIF